MSKENNCQCGICQVEHDLLDSLSTQTARIHFQVLASNHPILSHFNSPADVIVQLHEHEQVETDNHNAWNEILHALVEALADTTTEDIGQQLLLVAYAPAIHKVYREVCQKFPGLSPEDVGQQAALCFLETTRSPEIRNLNGHLPAALVRRFRQSLFRWAIGELRQSRPLEEITADPPEPPTSSFEHAITLDKILQQAVRDGLLSESEHQLLLKLKQEGFEVKELVEAGGMISEDPPRWFYRRLQTIVDRLRRAVGRRQLTGLSESNSVNRLVPTQPEKNSQKITLESVNFPEQMCTRKNEKGFSPELPQHVPQFEPDIAHTSA